MPTLKFRDPADGQWKLVGPPLNAEVAIQSAQPVEASYDIWVDTDEEFATGMGVAGGDLAGTYPNPTVKKISDTSGSNFKLVVRSGAMSMATSGNTLMAFDALTVSARYGSLPVTLANSNQDVVIGETGYYDLAAMANFSPHATGSRTLQILVSGGAVAIARQMNNGASEYVHMNVVALGMYMTAGTIIQVALQQGSGTLLASSPSGTYQQLQIKRVG